MVPISSVSESNESKRESVSESKAHFETGDVWAHFLGKAHSVLVTFLLFHDVEERHGIFIRFLVE